jgi:hypothetical protein
MLWYMLMKNLNELPVSVFLKPETLFIFFELRANLNARVN